jgi:hypothetical protein
VVKHVIMRTNVEAPVQRKNLRSTQDSSPLIDSLWILLIQLICLIKNTQVSFFTNGHFQPTPFAFLFNAPSLTPLICCSLSPYSFSSAYSPLCFHLLQFHITTLRVNIRYNVNKFTRKYFTRFT